MKQNKKILKKKMNEGIDKKLLYGIYAFMAVLPFFTAGYYEFLSALMSVVLFGFLFLYTDHVEPFLFG